MNICVFCSAKDVAEGYVRDTEKLGRLLGERGHTLVWGGADVGLMRVIADSSKNAGARLIGIAVKRFDGVAYTQADELMMAETLSERKGILLKRSDAFVVLPGGTGTLDEMAETVELKKYGTHDKPVAIFNSGGFYDGLKVLFARMEAEGFLPRPLKDIVHIANTPEGVLDYIERYGR